MSRSEEAAGRRGGALREEAAPEEEAEEFLPLRAAPARPGGGPLFAVRPPGRSRAKRAAAGLVIAAAAGLAIDAFLVEPDRVETRRSTEYVASLRASGPDLLLVHLSDTHIAGLGARERRAITIVNAARPDIVVITGDLVRGASDPGAVAAFLSSIQARYGRFLVWGNHDHYERVAEGWGPEVVRRSGFTLLDNAGCRIETPAGRIDIAGVDDPVTGHDNFKAAMSGIARRDFCILLSHSPEIVRGVGNWDIDMVLAGHTHGGQVRLPWLGAIVVPFGTRPYIEGWFDAPGGVRVHVNQGLGWSYLPIRFLCRPRIDLITLRGGLPPGTRARVSSVG